MLHSKQIQPLLTLVTAIAERFYEGKPNKLDEFEYRLPLAQTKNCFTDLCSKTEELAKTCFQLGQLSSNYYDYDKIDYPEMVNSFSLFFKKDFVILSSICVSIAFQLSFQLSFQQT